jgi:tetratricopeptide (TPR) repeat protein
MPSPSRPSVPLPLVGSFLLVAVTVLAYAPVFQAGFVNLDDFLYVSRNPHVLGGLTRGNVRWAWSTFHSGNWHPLTWLSLQLDVTVYGSKAFGFHLTNVLLHTANAILLFQILRRGTGAVGPSFAVAALFAWHPLHVESVAWVTERKDVLSTFFGLLALGAYLRYVEQPGWRRYLVLTGAFALSLLAKSMLVTLPFLLLVLDWWPLRRVHPAPQPRADGQPMLPAMTWRGLLAEKVPLLVLSAGASVIAILSQAHGGAIRSFEDVAVSQRVANAVLACTNYLRQTFWPMDLAPYYPLSRPNFVHLLGSVLILAAVSAVVVVQARRRPHLLVGWLWFAGLLVPVLGLVQVGGAARADRYTYLPLVGTFLILAWLGGELAQQGKIIRRAVVACAAGMLTSCALLTGVQATYWKDSETLWRHALEVTPPSPVALRNLGMALAEKEEAEAALQLYSAALRLDPDDDQTLNELGVVLLNSNRTAEAIEAFTAAIRVNPSCSSAHYSLGLAASRTGNVDEALRQSRETLRLDPDNGSARLLLGLTLVQLGRHAEAGEQFQAFSAAHPTLAQGLLYLGGVLAWQGSYAEAADSYREAIWRDPASAAAWTSLSGVLARSGQGAQAVAAARKAVELNPRSGAALASLGWALHEFGDKAASRTAFTEAMRLDPNWLARTTAAARHLATDPDPARRNGAEAAFLAAQASAARDDGDAALLDTLAAARAEQGRFDEAVELAARAWRLVDERSELAGQIRAHLQLFGNHQPLREASP